MKTNDWQNRRILILGAARQGLALARFLTSRGADVTVSDKGSADDLSIALDALKDLPIHWALGGHPLDLLDQTDMVCVSGGVPLTLPIIREALRRQIPLSNDSQIFMESVPCPVIGITGSAGKTTTTTLVGRMAHAFIGKPRQAWVGGNIGLPLIDRLDEIHPDDVVILELSSFQLELMTRSPHMAAVLNITPNHLDRHGTLEAYTAAKARILEFQTPDDIALLNREDAGSWNLKNMVKGKLVTFGLQKPDSAQTGTYFDDGSLWWTDGGQPQRIMDAQDIHLKGVHNLMSVLAACAIAAGAGFPLPSMKAGVEGFYGVEHRLEFIRCLHGVDWYNDSIATAPERTLAALHSFEQPIVLLLGGRDKKLPWDGLARQIHRQVDHVVLFGEARDLIYEALSASGESNRTLTIDRCATFEQGLEAAARVAEAGDVVLLSPGCTSYDEFRDFSERGEKFREWLNRQA